MKMILTRQGFNSKMVVTGDTTQIDLQQGQRSGLIEVIDVLRGVEGISFVQFDDRDVVRHTLVQKIVKAYERYNEAIGANRQLSLKLTDPAAADTSAELASREASQPAREASQPVSQPALQTSSQPASQPTVQPAA
jgi:phosphate starvation-inducible PhoH-like protein